MDDPVVDIPNVIYGLTTASSHTQQRTLERFFTPDASFTHPFCAVHNNRITILRIFQWYKILSPHVSLQINSIAYDEQNLRLYVNISQLFAIWFVPFHRSPVTLTTVLQLAYGQNLNIPSPSPPSSTSKYYIKSQNDLYQVDQFVRFFAPWGVGSTIIAIWHWFATLFCIAGARLLQPVHSLFAELSRPMTGHSNGEVQKRLQNNDTTREERDERIGVDEAIQRSLQHEDGVKPRTAYRPSGGTERMDRESLYNGNG